MNTVRTTKQVKESGALLFSNGLIHMKVQYCGNGLYSMETEDKYIIRTYRELMMMSLIQHPINTPQFTDFWEELEALLYMTRQDAVIYDEVNQ